MRCTVAIWFKNQQKLQLETLKTLHSRKLCVQKGLVLSENRTGGPILDRVVKLRWANKNWRALRLQFCANWQYRPPGIHILPGFRPVPSMREQESRSLNTLIQKKILRSQNQKIMIIRILDMTVILWLRLKNFQTFSRLGFRHRWPSGCFKIWHCVPRTMNVSLIPSTHPFTFRNFTIFLLLEDIICKILKGYDNKNLLRMLIFWENKTERVQSLPEIIIIIKKYSNEQTFEMIRILLSQI